MEEIKEINNVEQFINEIQSLNKENSHLYYRGQNHFDYNLLPGILRNKSYYENEDQLFTDFLTECPDLFKNCENNYDRLAIMQHHQLPTRLLDITANPLIALFFACDGKEKDDDEEKDGSVFVFTDKVEKETVEEVFNFIQLHVAGKEIITKHKSKRYVDFYKSPYSDEIELEASLIRLSKENKKQIADQVYEFLKSIPMHEAETNMTWNEAYNYWIQTNKGYMNDDFWSTYQALAGFNSIAIQNLFHEIKTDVFNYRVMMNPIDLLTPKLVKPRTIDSRIKNQKGTFIFVPFIVPDKQYSEVKAEDSELIDMIRYRSGSGKTIKYRIPQKQKEYILEELATLGINRSFIYPDDYSMVAGEIKEKFMV